MRPKILGILTNVNEIRFHVTGSKAERIRLLCRSARVECREHTGSIPAALYILLSDLPAFAEEAIAGGYSLTIE